MKNKKIERLVIATRNPAKKERYKHVLGELVKEVVDLADVGISDKPQESGTTAELNAEIKAKFYSERTNLPVFCEDETLEVDFLPKDKQPGTHVRRINGKDEVDDNKLLVYWEKVVAEVPKQKRTGRWHIAYSFALPSGVIKTASLDHPIMFFSPSSEIRLPGWPMSSLEGPLNLGKPHSELTYEEKREHDKKTDLKILKIFKELTDHKN
jgi:inosine/xanthosine triphosphate pyrophosphatase family protein